MCAHLHTSQEAFLPGEGKYGRNCGILWIILVPMFLRCEFDLGCLQEKEGGNVGREELVSWERNERDKFLSSKMKAEKKGDGCTSEHQDGKYQRGK